jgi:hypothetical protein
MSKYLHNNHILRKRFAESEPKNIALSISFWLRQGKFILMLLVSIGAISVISLFIYQKPEELLFSLFFSFVIYFLFIIGIYIASKSMVELEIEHAIAIDVEKNATDILTRLKSGQMKMIDLDKVEADVIPDNISKPEPAMIRMFYTICREAKDRKFESVTNTIQHPCEEALKNIFQLQQISKIALRLGILGTFIGLVLAIFHLGVLINNEINPLSLFPQLFNDLHISFSTSIAGLEVALAINIFLMILQNKHEHYFRDMNTAASTMLSLVRRSINKDDFLVEFEQVTNSMRSMGKELDNLTFVLSKDLVSVEKRIEDQTSEIGNGMTALSKSKAQLDDFLKTLSSSQQAFIKDIQSIYDIISLKDINKELEEKITLISINVSKGFEGIVENVSSLLNNLNNANTTITNSNTSLVDQTKNLSDNMKGIETKIMEQTDTMVDVFSQFKEFLKDINDSQNHFADKVNNIHEIVSSEKLSDYLRESIIASSSDILNHLSPSIEAIADSVVKVNGAVEKLNKTTKKLNTRIELSNSKVISFLKIVGFCILLSGGFLIANILFWYYLI